MTPHTALGPPGHRPRALARVVAAFAALVELAAPSGCAGCGRVGDPVCPGCHTGLQAAWFADGPRTVRTLRQADGTAVPCTAAGGYVGSVRPLLHAYKDGDRRDLAPLLAPGLLAAVLAAVPPGPGGVVLVPAPSSRAAERRRGDRPTCALAEAAARAEPSGRVRTARLLEVRHRVADQSALGRAGRARNVDHAYRVRDRAALPSPRAHVVVVDDVLTTGATAGECVRALAAAGVAVRAVATALATPRATPARGAGPPG